jgi:hypothetical protein
MFSGSEMRTVQASAGQTLVVEYDARISKGALDIQVTQPGNQVIWEVSLAAGAGDTARIPVQRDGSHAIVVRGDGTRGGFNLSWGVE